MNKSNTVHRKIRWYAKDGNKFVGEWTAYHLEISSLRKLFKVKNGNDPMYDSYPIRTNRQIKDLEKSGLKFDTSRYVYFLEA